MSLAETRAHYETQARDALGRFEEAPKFDFLNRYFAEPAFRDQVDAEREANSRRQNIVWDAGQVRQFARTDDEPGFVSALRVRVITYARAEKDYALLITAGIPEAEARAIIATPIEGGTQ